MTFAIPRAVSIFRDLSTTGSTVTVLQSDATVQLVLINNPGLLATLTVSMPTGSFDGQIIRFVYKGAITILLWSGVTVANPYASALATGYAAYVWDDIDKAWRRCA